MKKIKKTTKVSIYVILKTYKRDKKKSSEKIHLYIMERIENYIKFNCILRYSINVLRGILNNITVNNKIFFFSLC
jgi:hypothetical protein